MIQDWKLQPRQKLPGFVRSNGEFDVIEEDSIDFLQVVESSNEPRGESSSSVNFIGMICEVRNSFFKELMIRGKQF